MIAATTIATIQIQRTISVPWPIGRFRPVSVPTVLPSTPSFSVAMLCRRKLIANVATSIVAGDAERRRSGRNARTSRVIVSAITTAKQTKMLSTGLRPFVSASAYAPAITSWPYAKLTSRRTPNTSPMPTAISA